MRVLIAEDDPVSRTILARMLTDWGHYVLAKVDGEAAWEILQLPDAPKLAILDWMMPKMDGLEVCRRVSELASEEPTYLILLTAKDQTGDVVVGLDAGANDYVVKPFDRRELQARVRVGERIVQLQRDLGTRIHELQNAIALIHHLQELLPICSYCKRIRNDQSYWEQVDAYLFEHAGVQFTHSVCPDCYEKVVAELERAGA